MFMGRPVRVARSRRFLREETKAVIESESTSDKLIPDEETTETPPEV